jgi:autotransporter-associated beta strand protein/T5SS/PEP-CTERM-associated repeat protein
VTLNANRGIALGTGGGTLRVTSGDTITYGGIIAGTTGLAKEGAGQVTLSGASTYSGTTDINGGEFVVNGSADSSAFAVDAGTILGGTGSVDGVTLNGQVAPGNAVDNHIGEFEVSGLTVEAGSSYRWELGDASGSTDRDVLKVGATGTDTVTINASAGTECTIYLDDSEIDNWNAGENQNWTIIDAGTLANYNATDFTLDDSAYWSTALYGGTFSVSNESGDLVLYYDAPDVEPALGVGPASMSFSVPLGTTPSEDTLSVTNQGGGTLNYTNTMSYGPNWGSMSVTITAETGSLALAAFQVHTASLSKATAIGTFAATNTISGNQTNADHVIDITYTVTNLQNSTGLSVSDRGTRDITVNWTRPGSYNVVVVRRQGANPDPPTNGTAYAHDATYGADGRNQVVYAAGSGATDTDTGLDPQTIYHYGFFTENFDYYSPGAFLSTTTLTSEVDGNDEEWVGIKPTVVNSAGMSANEFIWSDKEGEQRNDSGNGSDVDMHEFRVRADADDLYFMVKYQDMTDIAYPYVAVGVDTDRNGSDTAMNWIADDSDTGLGDGYYTNGNAAMHYPEYNVIVHTVPNVGQRIELHEDDESSWKAPPTHGNTATYFEKDSNEIVEFKIARSDLGLSGEVTARLTVASYFNNTSIGDNQWANDGDTTADYGGSDAQDTLSVLPYGVNDAAGDHGTAGEETDDNDLDTFFDIRFDADGLAGNQLPTAPDISDAATTFPIHNTSIEEGAMSFAWPAGSDADDDVTSYFLEVSTDSGFNGGENTVVSYRANTRHTNRHYTVSPGPAAAQYYWRVRSRDLGGMLSGHTTNTFTVSGSDDDTTGPTAKLIYIGTSYAVGLSQTNITDQDLNNTADYVDIAVEWSDISGVFMTNAAAYPSTNILSSMGRVIPNWDLYTTNRVTHATKSYGYDEPFTNFLGANMDVTVTTVYYNAFAITNINTNDLFFLSVSGEDEDNDRGVYPDPQGDGDDVPHDRSVTTNAFVQFIVTDDDEVAPEWSGLAIAGTSRGNGIVLGDELLSGSWNVTGMVRDVYSGIHVNGASTSEPTNSPYLTILDPTGSARLTTVFDSFTFTNGQANSYEPISNASPAGISGAIPSGTWTVRVVAADNDFDRPGDRLLTTNTVAFSVPTFEWDAGGGANRDWSTAANWTVDTEPAGTDTAHVNGGHTAVVSQAAEAAYALLVGDDAFSGGLNGTGTVEQTGGDLTVGTTLVLGENQGDLGSYSIDGGDLVVSNDMVVGDMGRGLLTVTGTADVAVGVDLRIGDGGFGAEDSGSTVTVGGGTLAVAYDVRLGDSDSGADGSMSIVGGAVRITNSLHIGHASGSTGTVTVSGGQLSVNIGNSSGAKALTIGASGHGSMTVTGSAVVDTINTANGDVVVGGDVDNGHDNRLTVSGSAVMNVGDNLEVGNASGAVGTLAVSGGALNVFDEILVGNVAGSTGAVTITGGAVTNGTDENITVGNSGEGAMTVSGSGVLRTSGSGDLVLGANASGAGNIVVDGGEVDIASTLDIAVAGSGAMIVSSGVVNVDSELRVGVSAPGTLTIDGGVVTTVVFRAADNADAGGSVFNMNGGTLTVTDAGANAFQVDYGATLNIDGGTIDADEYNLSRNGDGLVTVNLSGGTIGGDNNFNVGAGGSVTGKVYQTGGTLDLNGASGELRIGYDAEGTFGHYTITGGVISVEDNLELGRSTASGTGVFHVVGSVPDITIGQGTSGDFNMRGDNANLWMTFVDSSVSTIQVADVISLDGTLTVSNQGAVASGEYLILTSLTDIVSSTFDTVNWTGSDTGKVIYGSDYVSLSFNPDIDVLGTNDAVIANGDLSPSAADGTAYPELVADFESKTHTFTVTNTGHRALILAGATTVDIAWDTGHFVVTQPAGTNIAPGESISFDIKFEPHVVGLVTALVSIANNDADKTPYTFKVEATGKLAPAPTTHASDLLFTEVTNTQMRVSWVNGDGEKRIVVSWRGAAVSGTPANSTVYSADSVYDNGQDEIVAGEYVIMNSTDTNVLFSGLSPGSNYYFAVFEYNGNLAGTHYLTDPVVLAGNQAAATYPPVITEGTETGVTMSENGNPTAFSLTLNATDPDPGDILTWSIRNAPEHGTATASGTGLSKAISYSPNEFYSGSDSFVVQVTDKFGNDDTLTVNVTIKTVSVPGKPVFIFE